MFEAVFREAGPARGPAPDRRRRRRRRRGARHRPEHPGRVVHRLDRRRAAGRRARRRHAQEGLARARRQQRVHRPRRRGPRRRRRRPARSRPSSSRARSASRPGATSSTRRVAGDYIDALREKAKRLRMGDPYREDVQLGPIVNEKQVRRVDDIVQRSIAGGAAARRRAARTRACSTGRRSSPRSRRTCRPGPTRSSARSRRSRRSDTDEEAIALANGSEYGLVGVDLLALARRAAWRSPTGSRPAWSTSTTARSTTRRPSRSAGWADPATAAATAARRTSTTSPSGSGSRCATSRRRSRSDARLRGIHHRRRQARRRLDGDRVAGRLRRRRTPVSAATASARARRRPDARLRPERPGPRAAQEPHPGRRRRSSTTSPTRISREVVRGVEDAASPGGYLVITCSSDRDRRARELVRPPAAVDARRDAHLRRQRARRPGAQRARCAGTSRRCAPTARRSSTSRRTRSARPRSASTTRPGSPSMVAALVRPRASPDRVPRRADVAVRGPPAAGRLPPRSRRGRHPVRRAARREHRLRPRGRRARRSTRCSPGTRRSRAICAANDLLALGALRPPGRARHRRARARSRSRASTTSRPRR